MLKAEDYRKYWELGLPYLQYLEDLNTALQNPDFPNKEHLPMNSQRMGRVYKSMSVAESWIKSSGKLNWLVITELWCGDSSQITPALARIAEGSEGKISIRFIYRDANPELIDAHLTNNGRAIPKLLILDEDFNLIKTWGPRPKAAQDLVVSLKSNPETASQYQEKLHLWYAKDKQATIQDELWDIMQEINSIPHS